MESKRGRIRGVKYWKTALAILAALSTSLAVADDFKTTNGKEYKNATVTRVEPDGIVVKSKSGISKVYFVELPKDLQERFHYDPQKAAAAHAAEQAAVQQENERNKQEQGRQSAQRQANQTKQRQWAEQQAKQGNIQNLVDRLDGLQKQEEIYSYKLAEQRKQKQTHDALGFHKEARYTAPHQKRSCLYFGVA